MSVTGEILKVLGQSTPTATVLTELYEVPASFSAVVSSISICNQSSSVTAVFRVSIAPGGAANDPSQYIYYDLPLAPNDTFVATIGISLAMGDIIRIQSNTSNVSFNLLGIEVGAFSPPPANLAGGDLSGFYPNPVVRAIQGNDVKPQSLGGSQDGYVLTWNNIDGYWEAETVKELQGNLVKPESLGSIQDGYVLTWNNTDGYWEAEAIPTSSGGAVIFDSGTPSNLRSNRSVDQSPVDNTKVGILNLSSDTTGVTGGAQANFATIVGGDQNVIAVNSDGSGILSGQANEINDNLVNTGSAASITLNSNASLTSSGLSITVEGNVVSVWGYSSVVGAVGNTLTITGAASANNNGSFIILGGNTLGGGNGYDVYNPHAPQGTDANNGSIATTGSYVLVSGLTGMTDIGGAMTFTGAATSDNNGTFAITQFIDANNIYISNVNAVTDANNGSITWVAGSQFSSVLNGMNNAISSPTSTVLTGLFNRVNGICSVVAGNMGLIREGGNCSSILGGTHNTIIGDANVVCGGSYNSIPGTSGGLAANCNIGGGSSNSIISNGSDPSFSNIGGGINNNIYNHANCVIAGGNGNFMNAVSGVISGGDSNQVNNSHGSVGGGASNIVNGDYTTIVGGQSNVAAGLGAVCGGVSNTASGDYSTCFGTGNTAGSNYTVALGTQSVANGNAAFAMGIGGTQASGTASVALGFSSIAQRVGELSLSSTGDGNAQLGLMAIGGSGTNTSFVLQDAGTHEFSLKNSILGPAGNNYYSINIRVVASATNAAVGPATWTWELLAYTVGGVATLVGGSATAGISMDNGTGWLNTVTVDGSTDIIHITINTNTDTTNTVQATAFLQWAQVKAFSQ